MVSGVFGKVKKYYNNKCLSSNNKCLIRIFLKKRKELIFFKRRRNTAVIFNLYLLAITLNALSVYFSEQPVGWLQFSDATLSNDITFSFALLLVIILSFRNEWITYRSRKQKIIYFFLYIFL